MTIDKQPPQRVSISDRALLHRQVNFRVTSSTGRSRHMSKIVTAILSRFGSHIAYRHQAGSRSHEEHVPLGTREKEQG